MSEGVRARAGRVAYVAYFLAAPLICLAVFWRVPFTWFMSDDFAWLGLPLQVHRVQDLGRVFFHPQAQGTVRVLSERLFFLTFSSLFGLNALPYRIWVLATWSADLVLAVLIGIRLTGSRAAGLLAAILWTTSAAIVTPLIWASAYNEVLCAFFVLLAFYARMRWIDEAQRNLPVPWRRKWILLEWISYLAGFGALEVIVMYPAIATLYSLCTDRKRWRTALPLWIPAAIFAAVHFFLIPKQPGSIYALSLDSRLPGNFGRYLGWTLGPSRMGGLIADEWRVPGIIVTALIGLALAAFAASRLRRGEWTVVFCFGWFVLLLAPMLGLPNHVSDYYLTLPALGLAWLGGWAIVTAWRAGIAARGAAILLTATYLAGSIAEIDAQTRWYYDHTIRIRDLVLAARDQMRSSPDSVLLLHGVDNELFQSGFQDDPFRLVGATRVYLTAESEKGIVAREDLGGIARFQIPAEQALALLERGQARVIEAGAEGARDVTRSYTAVAKSQIRSERRSFVDVGDPFYAARLGPTWYPAENGFRWMPKKASVRLPGPHDASEKLNITGFAAAPALAAGPVTLSVRAGGHDLGSTTLREPGAKFAVQFPLPADLVGQENIEITLELSKGFRPPGENRDLGMIFGTFEIR